MKQFITVNDLEDVNLAIKETLDLKNNYLKNKNKFNEIK